MDAVILRAVSLTLVIVMGIVLRSTSLVNEKAGAHVKTILLDITLPAAIITNFSKVEGLDGPMAALIFLGIAANMVMIAAGAFLSRRKPTAERAFYMNCLPAYNIGTFCLPFVQSFLAPLGNVAACLFDAGNSIMCTGGTYSINAEYLSEHKNGIDPRAIAKRLFASVPLMTYMAMIALSLVHIKIPPLVLDLLSPAAAANTFLAMLMIGLLFRIEFKRAYLASILKIILVRHAAAILMSLFYYFALPFDLAIRQALVLVSFGPMSVIAPVFTGLCGGDEGKASAADSITIVLSVVEITLLLIVMGIY